MTALDGGDADVGGWADSVLVRTFAIRDGRRRTVGAAGGDRGRRRRRAVGDPARLAPDFARRNAELAAALLAAAER